MDKKLFALIFFMFLLVVPLISAWEFDNIKNVDYSNLSWDYPTITIRNSFLWIIPLDPIGTYQITDNTDICGEDCYTIGTAELYLDAELFSGSIYEDLITRDKKTITNSEWFVRTIIPNTFKEECVEVINNETQESILACKIVEVKSQQNEWEEYTLGTILKSGKYEWKHTGSKGYYEGLDFIPKSNGITMNEFVDWGAGGTITYDGDFTIHTFLVSNNFSWTGVDSNAFILVIAGGGGGGIATGTSGGGGGGAGGYRYNTTFNLTEQNYSVTIGTGGAGSTVSTNKGVNGINSSFDIITSIGGGGGGSVGASAKQGETGGSSGGNVYSETGATEAAAVPAQGNVGGSGAGNLANAGGGGGGGAGQVGESGFGGDGGEGGDGGDGTQNNINGTNIYYAGGGGAGGGTAGEGTGGLGGGADGGITTNGVGGDATDNTGGGGGGGTGAGNGGAGGSGIVIIRYESFNPTLSIEQSYPVDYFNTTDLTINFGCNFTGKNEENVTDVTILIYDSGDNLDYTNTESSLNTPSYNKTWTSTVLTDDTYLWACFGEGTTTEEYAGNRTFIINTTPAIEFEDPTFVNFYNSTVNNFFANVSLTETYFENVTFNLWNSSNNLISSNTFTDSTRAFNYTVTYDGKYNYSVITSTTTGQGNITETRTINIDATAPIINIDVAQTTISGLQLVPYNISINHTEIDSNLQTCFFNSTWNATITYLTCNQNLTNITLPVYGLDHTIFIYANDSLGQENVASKSVSIDGIEITQSYSNITTEGTFSTFQINITIPTTRILSLKDFIYNFTNFGSGTSIDFGISNHSITKSILIPNVGETTNMTFFWNITLDDDTLIASSKQNQTVNNFGLDNCTANNIAFANFTIVDEEIQNLLTDNVTLEIAVNIFSSDRTINIANFSELYNATNPVRLCLSSNVTGETIYSLDLIARYEAQDHANEYYNLNKFILNSDFKFQNVFLYDLSSSDSTEFQLTFKGSDFVAVEGALVNLKRQYIQENLFKTVELPLTDSNGQTILHLVRNDVVYTIEIVKDNVVLGTFSNIIAFCDDFAIGDCKINLNAFSTSEDLFNYDDEIGIIFTAPTFDNNTRIISFDFTTIDGSVKDVSLFVTRNDIFGNNSICNYSLSSSSGTLLCTVPSYIDDSTLNIEVLVDDQLSIKDNVILESTGYGYFGFFIFFIYILAFVFMFSGSKSIMLVGLLIGFIGGIVLGLIQGKLIGIGASGMWLIIIIILMIYKINKKRED